MAWRHKKESKWLVVGKRKVRCYLCGRKILRTDSRIYDPETGHYSHASCETERSTIDGNDRRKAVKKLAISAGIAGLVAVGADKFPGFVSQSEKTDAQFQTAMETIITSQGIILPSLSSDPANPAPGQIWYRSDAGVIAHFDAIQNRVVYSSEINDGNVNVTSKGIVNGLSVLPNDGTGGFGPDTKLGATSPSQYGPPYTQTTGIQEAWNYAFATATTGFPNESNIKPGGYWMKPVKLLDGLFILNEQVVIDPQVPLVNPKMIGSGTMSTYVYWNFNDHAIIINPSNTNIMYSNIEIGYMQPQPGGNVTGNVGFFAMLYTSSNPAYQSNTFQSYDMDLASGDAYVFWLQGAQRAVFYNLEAYSSGSNSGGFYIENCPRGVYAIGCPHMYPAYLNGASKLYIIGGNEGGGLAVGNVNYVYIDRWSLYNAIQLLSDVAYIHIDMLDTAYPGPFIISSGSTSFTVDHINIGELLYYGSTGYTTQFTGSGTGYTTANVNLLELGRYTFEGTNGGGISGVWTFTPTTPSVPSSGTAQQNTNPYAVDVYVYGGDVTEIQITRNGTAYTVLSDSSGVAMSGQSYKLNPGDSMTLTYATAPTWKWLSD